jgi:hypothetical protein
LKGNLLLALASFLVAILSVEFGLWAISRWDPRPPLYPGDRPVGEYPEQDLRFGWTLPPDTAYEHVSPTGSQEFLVTYIINGAGFRDEREFTCDSSRVTIAFLGDSFTFGYGVEGDETFARLIEQQLAGTRSYNFGVPGYGIDQMYLTLRHYGKELRPRLVLLALIRDDMTRSLSAYRIRDSLFAQRLAGTRGWLSKPLFGIRDDSLTILTEADRPNRLFRFIRDRSRILEGWRRATDRLDMRYPVSARWKLNQRLLEATRDLTAELGADFLVVRIPELREIESGPSPIPLFQRKFEEMGIHYLDLGEALPERPDTLFYPKDGHLNVRGHRFAADRILEYLRTTNLEPMTDTRVRCE